MSDDIPDNQFATMQIDPDDVNEQYENDEHLEDLFNEPTASTHGADDQVSANDAAQYILYQDDVAFAHDVLGVEGFQEMESEQEEQHEVHEPFEDNLQAKSELPEHADAHFEPKQEVQRTSQEPLDHDEIMDHAADAPNDAAATIAVAIPGPDQHNAEVNDSTSLFIPEYSPAHSTAPVPLPPSLSDVPSRQTSIPVRSASFRSSIFSKVRAMQKNAQDRKAALHKATPTRMSEDVDAEAYLEAVTAGITPPSGAFPQPAVDEDEMAHRMALAEFQKQKKHYEGLRRKNGGRLGFRNDVEWMKIKGNEDVRVKKRQRMLAEIHESEEQDLFPPVRNPAYENDEEIAGNSFGEGSSRKRRRGEQPYEQNESVSFQAAELRSMNVALEAANDNPKRKKKAAGTGDGNVQPSQPTPRSQGSRSKSSRAPRSKPAAKVAKGSRRTAKNKRALENATRQATSLLNANVFEQQAGQETADQPTFRTQNKSQALKELIASVPVADKTQCTSDMNVLLSATKDFDGRGACRLAPGNDGNWLVRGMATSLKGYQVLGAAFMRRRENDAHEPRGGLVADQMGLGKTLMTLGK